ncbi:MAG: peptidylprolyl isomerase, partial [Gammaproteobacteria bacterium]
KYPGYEIEISVLNDIQITKLPDIYQNNLQVLDENNFTKTFQTGKGFTMLKVLNSNMFKDEYKVSHILMKTNPMDDIDKVKENFYKIKKGVLDGNDFSYYAKKYSLDKTSAIKGGTLGWITKEMVVDNFRRVMVSTPTGEISEPFKTQYGWHILYLEDKRTKNMYSDIQRNQVISILKDRKVLVAKKEWLSKLRDQAYIKVMQ